MVSLTLIVSLAAPTGAVFASQGDGETLQEVSPIESPVTEVSNDDKLTPVIPASGTQTKLSSKKESAQRPIASDQKQSTSQSESLTATSVEKQASELEKDVSIAPPADGVVLAQVQVGSTIGANDEYVSIYNNTDTPIDITGWCLSSKKAAQFVCLNEPEIEYEIAAHSFVGMSTDTVTRGARNETMQFQASNRNYGYITSGSDTVSLHSGAVVVDEIMWTKPVKYAVERKWHTTQPNVLQGGVATETWTMRDMLETYGSIEPLVECVDGSLSIRAGDCPVEASVNTCDGLVFSEIGVNVSDQFIEIRNIGSGEVSLVGCQIKASMSNRTTTFVFSEGVIAAGAFSVVHIDATPLTLNKSTGGIAQLLSSDGSSVAVVDYGASTKNTSWIVVGSEWKQTHHMTPGDENRYEPYKACSEGYWRNQETGRCNKAVAAVAHAACGSGRERNPATGRCRTTAAVIKTLKPCLSHQYRSPETNRCRSILSKGGARKPCKPGQYRNPETKRCRSVLSSTKSLKPCRADQVRNPETNRCKKIASTGGLKPCKPGQERNPTTNRCRKILASAPPAANFAVEPTEEPTSVYVGWFAMGAVAFLAAGYAVWEWRHEMSGLIRRAMQVIHKGK